MKNFYFSFVLFFSATLSYGQISYEKGYFLDNKNQITDCFIKNDDWNNNPDKFYFRQIDSDIPREANIEYVKEFCIDGVSKYIRANILIDRSSNDPNKLTSDKNPLWSQEQLFLKVLVEGKASLYYYRDGTVERFFYSVSDTAIYQLINKKYLIFNYVYLQDESTYAENNKFRQQLWIDVRCPGINMNSMENISYSQGDLTRYFIGYNSDFGDTIIDQTDKQKKYIFNLKIAPGISNSSWVLRKSVNNNNGELIFDNSLSYRFGLESELILPFNKNKWGILFEPTFQYCKTEKESNYGTGIINFSYVDFPIGLRYYGFLNNDLKMFIDCYYISEVSLDLNSYVTLNSTSQLSVYSSSFAFGAGIGYKRISAEIRCFTNRIFYTDRIVSYQGHSPIKQNSISVIIGYKLFSKKL